MTTTSGRAVRKNRGDSEDRLSEFGRARSANRCIRVPVTHEGHTRDGIHHGRRAGSRRRGPVRPACCRSGRSARRRKRGTQDARETQIGATRAYLPRGTAVGQRRKGESSTPPTPIPGGRLANRTEGRSPGFPGVRGVRRRTYRTGRECRAPALSPVVPSRHASSP